MFPKTLLILSCLALAACAEKAAPPVPPSVDFVSATLGQAAEQAHGELAMLARLRGQGMQPLLPPADPSLNLPISLTWTGEASGALKEICLQLGYRYRKTGAPTAQTMPIVVHGLNRPAQAVVRVDPVNRVLTLASTSGAEGRL